MKLTKIYEKKYLSYQSIGMIDNNLYFIKNDNTTNTNTIYKLDVKLDLFEKIEIKYKSFFLKSGYETCKIFKHEKLIYIVCDDGVHIFNESFGHIGTICFNIDIILLDAITIKDKLHIIGSFRSDRYYLVVDIKNGNVIKKVNLSETLGRDNFVDSIIFANNNIYLYGCKHYTIYNHTESTKFYLGNEDIFSYNPLKIFIKDKFYTTDKNNSLVEYDTKTKKITKISDDFIDAPSHTVTCYNNDKYIYIMNYMDKTISLYEIAST